MTQSTRTLAEQIAYHERQAAITTLMAEIIVRLIHSSQTNQAEAARLRAQQKEKTND